MQSNMILCYHILMSVTQVILKLLLIDTITTHFIQRIINEGFVLSKGIRISQSSRVGVCESS